jgi:predicted RNA binding protein YcfA (HicA-like mRNA interferase family)
LTAWPSTRASRVLAALFLIGWTIKRQGGSHKTLSRDGWSDYVYAFHDGEELGPKMLARIGRRAWLSRVIAGSNK